jgi:hypothetical protein
VPGAIRIGADDDVRAPVEQALAAGSRSRTCPSALAAFDIRSVAAEIDYLYERSTAPA